MDMEQRELGKFIHWGQPVSIDQARRMLQLLPQYQEDQVVEFECEDCPDTEELDIRISSY